MQLCLSQQGWAPHRPRVVILLSLASFFSVDLFDFLFQLSVGRGVQSVQLQQPSRHIDRRAAMAPCRRPAQLRVNKNATCRQTLLEHAQCEHGGAGAGAGRGAGAAGGGWVGRGAGGSTPRAGTNHRVRLRRARGQEEVTAAGRTRETAVVFSKLEFMAFIFTVLRPYVRVLWCSLQ